MLNVLTNLDIPIEIPQGRNERHEVPRMESRIRVVVCVNCAVLSGTRAISGTPAPLPSSGKRSSQCSRY
jgi:hypothetical protein